MDGGIGIVFGVERVGAKRVCACTSIESGVEGKVERIPGWNMEGTRLTRFQFKQDESSVGHPPSRATLTPWCQLRLVRAPSYRGHLSTFGRNPKNKHMIQTASVTLYYCL
jgi:hypothetical protein